jgi:Fe-S oxidoreductase
MWLEESIGTQINVERAREAIGTGAGVVSTACPYCTVMLDDGVKEEDGNGTVEVVELAVLLDRSIRRGDVPEGSIYGHHQP